MCVCGTPPAIIAIPSRGQKMWLWKWQPCHHCLIIPTALLTIIRRDRWRAALRMRDAGRQPSYDCSFPVSQSFSPPLDGVTGQTGCADCQAAWPSWLADEWSLHAVWWPGMHHPPSLSTSDPAASSESQWSIIVLAPVQHPKASSFAALSHLLY